MAQVAPELISLAGIGTDHAATLLIIEFNPKKSINCQARSVALFVFLQDKNLLEDALSDKRPFIRLLDGGEPSRLFPAQRNVTLSHRVHVGSPLLDDRGLAKNHSSDEHILSQEP